MKDEQDTYRERLMRLPPKDILQHSYEYTVREDILMVMENTTLPPHQCEALLKSPCLIQDIYDDFNKIETEHMDTIYECIQKRANKILTKEKEREGVRKHLFFFYEKDVGKVRRKNMFYVGNSILGSLTN